MKKPGINQINIQLLVIFDEVHKTRSVSQTAENLDLGQSVVSSGLAKLREHFHDRLFVKTPKGMMPTPHAAGLIQPIREALALLRKTFGHEIVFDPLTSNRIFRICMLDISQIVLMPALMNHLRTIAPNVRLEVAHITQGLAEKMESGAVDLAVGFVPQLQAGFYEQTLFKQDFVCLVAKDHPFIKDELTLEQFQEVKHMVVTTEGTGHWIVEKSLENDQIHRNVMLRLPSFLGLPIIIESTDLLVTVPRLLAEKLSNRGSIQLLEPPVKLPSYKVKQHWHERYHHDPGIRWLRSVFAELFMK